MLTGFARKINYTQDDSIHTIVTEAIITVSHLRPAVQSIIDTKSELSGVQFEGSQLAYWLKNVEWDLKLCYLLQFLFFLVSF